MSTPTTKTRRYNRIIALIDMDCFYCQVEEVLNPELKGKPIIVQPLQYDDFGGGGIIALNYVAKERGVKRQMRGDEAKRQCPDLELIKVPIVRGKADLSKYRNEGKKVADVLQHFTPLISRASVDEAYLDITDLVQKRLFEMNQGKFTLQPEALQNTYVVGYENIAEFLQYVTNKITHSADSEEMGFGDFVEEDRKEYRESDIKLLVASSIVNEIRVSVKNEAGYECSAGIAHNKTMAKLVSGLNKPNKQTIIPLDKIQEFYSLLPIRKVQNLGGKFGERVCDDLKVQFMGELIGLTKGELQKRFNEKNGEWLYNVVRGIDYELVTPHLLSKSIACCKKFPNRNALTTIAELNKWLHEIAGDIAKRIEQDELENNRRPKQMVVNFMQSIDNKDVSISRSVNMTEFDEDSIVNSMLDILKRNTTRFHKLNTMTVLNNPIKFLGLSVGKFERLNPKSKQSIQNLFQRSVGYGNNTKVLENQSTNSPSGHSDFENDALIDTDPMYSTELKSKGIVEKCIGANEQHQNQTQSEQPMPSTSLSVEEKLIDANQLNNSIPREEEKVECEECGTMLGKNELQIHTDAHLAIRMSQEPQERYQRGLKRKTTALTISRSSKKSRNGQSLQSQSSGFSIEKFLVRPSTSEATEYQCGPEMKKCDKCNKLIPSAELTEHMDFHIAKNLQFEMRRAEIGESKKNITKEQNATKNISSFFRRS